MKGWTAEERQGLRDAVPRDGLSAIIRGRTIQDVAKDVLALSRQGLDARGQVGRTGKAEAAFLDVLDETVSTGKTAADQMLDLYHGTWKGDISRVFRDFAY